MDDLQRFHLAATTPENPSPMARYRPCREYAYKRIFMHEERARVKYLLKRAATDTEDIVSCGICDWENARDSHKNIEWATKRMHPLKALLSRWRSNRRTVRTLKTRLEGYRKVIVIAESTRIGVQDVVDGKPVGDIRYRDPMSFRRLRRTTPLYAPIALALMDCYQHRHEAARRDAARATALALHAYGMVSPFADIEPLALKIEQLHIRRSAKPKHP